MAKSMRSKTKRAFRKIRREKQAEAPHEAERETRRKAVMQKSLDAGEAAQLQAAAEPQAMAGVQVEPQSAPAGVQADGEAPMELDAAVGSAKHSRKAGIKMRGKIQKGSKGKKPRNPLNIAVGPSNTQLAKRKTYKKGKAKRKAKT